MEARQGSTDIRSDLVAMLPKLRRLALTLCRDTAKVDALVSKACKQAIEKARSWKGDTRLECRLFALVRSAAQPEMQKARADEREPNHSGAQTGRVLNGRALIETLAADHAATFLLCAVEGLTYREAAAVLGTTEDAVGQTMLAVRRELRQKMAESSERSA